MHLTSTRRRLSGVALATAVAGGTLIGIAPVAQAAPVFVDAETALDPFAYARTSGGNCTVASGETSEPTVPVVENGPTASVSNTVSATYGNTNDGTDTGTANGSASATGKVTSTGGVLDTMDFSATSSYTLTNALASSTCYRYGWAGVDLNFTFSVTQPGFLMLDMTSTGNSYGEVYLYDSGASNDQPYYDNYGYGLKFNSDSRVFLPAGTYSGYFEGSSGVNNVPGTRSGTTSVHGEFALPGSQTSAAAGRGVKFVKFPAARNCSAHTLTPTITGSGKRAKKIDSVKFFVNGEKVRKISSPSKGEAVTLTLSDDQDANVRALVKLERVKAGVPAKRFRVDSRYIACS